MPAWDHALWRTLGPLFDEALGLEPHEKPSRYSAFLRGTEVKAERIRVSVTSCEMLSKNSGMNWRREGFGLSAIL